MALLNRLAGIGLDPEDPAQSKLSVGAFWAHLYELAKGKRTRQQVIDFFQLNAAETMELDWLIGRYNAQPNATAKADFVELINVIFYMAESRVPGYTTTADIQARINAI